MKPVKLYYFFIPITFSCLVFSCKDFGNKINLENIEKGKELYTSVGCATCHALSKDKLYGPSLHNILGTNITVIRNGAEHTITIDRDYIKKAIVDPDYEKPVSYQSSKMPKPMLSDSEIEYLVDYLMSINAE